jgi:hypothetical protein
MKQFAELLLLAVFALTATAFAGGEPRTAGYWRMWNGCSEGNKARVAAQNGGADAGFYILEDLLPQRLGLLDVTTCQVGVDILDMRAVAGADKIGDGEKMKSDAAYRLAANLLTAHLNMGAGAGDCRDVQDAVLEAETLLLNVEFNGTGKYLGPKHPQYQKALELEEKLVTYNTGKLCSP